jgi:hypothetical protein
MPLVVILALFMCTAWLVSADVTVLLRWHESASGDLSATAPLLAGFRRSRGRPRKFADASRAVTLTLPDSVIATLRGIHHDLSQAIVRLTQRNRSRTRRKGADLMVFGKRAVITIRPTPSLEMHAGVQLVPLPDGRALISFADPTSLAALQLSIADALDDADMPAADRQVYEHLGRILRDARRSDRVTLAQRHIIVLESARGARTNGKRPAARKG